jgi:hypothetical protein
MAEDLENMKEQESVETILARMDEKLKVMEVDVKDIKRDLKGDFVTKSEFESSCKLFDEKILPIRNIVFGLVGVVLMGAGYAIMKLIFNQ